MRGKFAQKPDCEAIRCGVGLKARKGANLATKWGESMKFGNFWRLFGK